MNIINATNVLDPVSWQEILVEKENIIGKGTGSITIHVDGTITKDTRLKSKVSEGKPFLLPHEYLVSKESIFNNQYTIDGFEPFLGKVFTKTLYRIKDILEFHGLTNPKPYMCRSYRSNKKQVFHKHSLSGHKPSKFYAVIYYMHPNWDTNYGGALHVGLSENELTHRFECLSNSLVAHNGYYGHTVFDLRLGYEGNRDIFLSHWATD